MKKTGLIAILLFFVGTASAQQTAEYAGLYRSTPEAEGIASDSIIKFLDAVEKQTSVRMHSFMLLRHGKIVAEGAWNPYDCNNKHTLYSVTKSFTSTAVGMCIDEGGFKLTDKVISFFPGDLPDTISPYLAELDIRDLLTMTVGHNPEPNILKQGNWIKAALAAPIANKPGTKYYYNNVGPFLLSAIVQKVTGQKLIDYLTPRLFDPLGIAAKDWEENPQGINPGGWGLRLSVESMAKLGQLYLQKGMWEGRQLISKEWVEEATKLQIDQPPQWVPAGSPKDTNDGAQGYGYLFWRCRHNAYRADGAMGQFIIVMPDQDAVLAMTSGNTAMQDEINLVWDYLLPAMKEGRLPDNPAAQTALEAKLSSLALPPPAKKSWSPMAKGISGPTYAIEPNLKGIEEVLFLMNGDTCKFLIKTFSERFEMNFGNGFWSVGETAKQGPYMLAGVSMLNWPSLYKVAGAYRWKGTNTMELLLHYTEGTHPQTYLCKFDGDDISIEIKDPLNPSDSMVVKGRVKR
jgi:CubicO group peptidase (beta-lactamase class C family)